MIRPVYWCCCVQVPAKRQKQDVVAEPPPEHRQADQQQPQLQQQSEPLPGAAAASWAVFQELDTKSAADSTADKALAAAGVVDGPPDPAGKNFSFTAQARRILLPQRGIGCSTQQESCVAYSSQQEAEQQLCSSDWGSQVPGGEPVPVEPAASQLSQQRQQQQQNMGASLVVGMQQQQEQLAAQHMQQWGSLQLTHQAVHSSTRSEVLESAAGHKPQQRQQAPLNGLMLRGMPANTAAADKVFGRPKNWAADKASKHFHQVCGFGPVSAACVTATASGQSRTEQVLCRTSMCKRAVGNVCAPLRSRWQASQHYDQHIAIRPLPILTFHITETPLHCDCCMRNSCRCSPHE